MPIAETNWEMTVAIAAPLIPMVKVMTNNKSRPIFRTVEKAKKYKGVKELPSAFNKHAMKL